jgi:hypothetical protein
MVFYLKRNAVLQNNRRVFELLIETPCYEKGPDADGYDFTFFMGLFLSSCSMQTSCMRHHNNDVRRGLAH